MKNQFNKKKISILQIILFLFVFNKSFATTLLTHAQIEKLNNETKITFQLSNHTQYKVFLLQNPNRIVADFSNTKLAFSLKNISLPSPEMNSIRSGHPIPNTLRLVFDVDTIPQIQTKSVDNKIYVSAFFPEKMQSGYQARKPVLVDKPAKHTTVIVIDAGHGGKDPGAQGPNGTQEKDVVLAIAKRLAELINQEPNMRAVLTRSGDYFVPLRGRLSLARKGKADIFMSIHADSYFNASSTGASVYALSHRGATSEAARWLARRENTSELGGVDLGELEDKSYVLRSVLIDLVQTATTTDSLRLGNAMLDALDDVTKLHYTRVEQAPFVVLKSPDIPSILVETGFISNAQEENRLRDIRYQNKIAQALYDGLRTYIKKFPVVG